MNQVVQDSDWMNKQQSFIKGCLDKAQKGRPKFVYKPPPSPPPLPQSPPPSPPPPPPPTPPPPQRRRRRIPSEEAQAPAPVFPGTSTSTSTEEVDKKQLDEFLDGLLRKLHEEIRTNEPNDGETNADFVAYDFSVFD